VELPGRVTSQRRPSAPSGRRVGRHSLAERIRDKGVGMTVAHSVLLLEPSDKLHVLFSALAANEAFPFSNGTAVLGLYRWKIRSRTLHRICCHDISQAATGSSDKDSTIGCAVTIDGRCWCELACRTSSLNPPRYNKKSDNMGYGTINLSPLWRLAQTVQKKQCWGDLKNGHPISQKQSL